MAKKKIIFKMLREIWWVVVDYPSSLNTKGRGKQKLSEVTFFDNMHSLPGCCTNLHAG